MVSPPAHQQGMKPCETSAPGGNSNTRTRLDKRAEEVLQMKSRSCNIFVDSMVELIEKLPLAQIV